MTASQCLYYNKVNRFIRSYCRKELWANPLRCTNIAIADPSGYMTDGTSTAIEPIGGAGGVSGAMTQDGVHPSQRGAVYFGMEILRAAEQWIGPVPSYSSRSYTIADGYDATLNPGGNFYESLPWLASTGYTVGQTVANDTGPVKRYICTAAGTSASSGGPTGSGTGITDGGVTWNYLKPAGMSLFASGTNGTQTAETGITYSGNLAGGWTLSRNSGSASGTIALAIENPWSNGQTGQRQSIAFSLGAVQQPKNGA